MRKFFLPILLIGSLMAHAQKQKPPLNYKAAFSFSPLALAQIDYTLMFGGEYRLRPGITLVTDIGYIFGSEYMKGEAKPAVGFVFRPSVKLFVNERNNFYLQPQLFYKQVTHQEYDWLGMECVNGIPTYEALTHFRYRRVVYGVNATAGAVLPRAKTGDGLTVEFYF